MGKGDPLITCEVGWGILPSFEGRGTRALIDPLRTNPKITSFIAHTFPSQPRSIRVMEKCGMVFDGDGEEPESIRYRLNLQL